MGNRFRNCSYGAGTGYCSTSSALGRKSTPTVTAAARTRSLSARVLSRPDGYARTTYTSTTSASQAETLPAL